MNIDTHFDFGQLTLDRINAAARYTTNADTKNFGVTRLFLTPEHRAVLKLLTEWMQTAGMSTTLDDAGNLRGYYYSDNPQGKTLIIGSHIDSVKQGGKFDGIMGVILGISCIQALHDSGRSLPYHVMIAAFGDEEGSRFQDSMIGSKALAGGFDSTSLARVDENGITMAEAMTAFGLNPDNIPACALDAQSILGYLEAHIEQGPILAQHNLPVGIVTAITGIERQTIEIMGETGHAGTVPMDSRQDALVAASKAIVAIDTYLKQTTDLVGVVGEISAAPGSVNVIPNRVQFSLEFRSPETRIRQQASDHFQAQFKAIADEANVKITAKTVYQSEATTCDPSLSQALAAAVKRTGHNPLHLFSGAGHDGQAMAKLTRIAMLFVRCKGGISHHPDESVSQEDLDVAGRVMLDFLQQYQPA